MMPIEPIKKRRIHQIVIFVIVAIFYANTLTLNYALDDRLVLLENEYTLEGGWQAVRDIFTKDSFSGFFGHDKTIVSGGRYRPMSQFSLMIEYELFGKKIREQIGDVHDFGTLHDPAHEKFFQQSMLPVVNHFMNILYFIVLSLLLYEVLSKILLKYEGEKWYQSLAFLTVVLFALHPIHTEVVANVKGRDEIFAMLGATATLWCAIQYVELRKWWYLPIGFLTMMFAIFSKENAITYLAVIPLTIFFFNTEKKRGIDYLTTLAPAMIASIFFIWARGRVLGGMMPADETNNILNNPFINVTKGQEVATVILTWGIYLKLLLFPHPLTHDYYPHQIEIVDFSSPLVWLVLFVCVASFIYAVTKLKSRSIISYALLFFICTFSITSNLIFNIGTFMNERFVFIPSLGFTLLMGYGLYYLAASPHKGFRNLFVVLIAVVGVLYGVKTFTRNFVWKDDLTLFLTDVRTSENSIKCNVSAGGSALQLWKSGHKERDRVAAYKYLDKALKLDNHTFNAYLLLGELMYLDGNVKGATQAYQNAVLIDSNNRVAKENLKKMKFSLEDETLKPIVKLLDEGVLEQNAEKVFQAYDQINSYLKENPQSLIGRNILGNVLGRGMGRLDEAIQLYEEVVADYPNFASAWENMGIAFALKQNFEKAEECLNKALEFAPENENIKRNIETLRQERKRRGK